MFRKILIANRGEIACRVIKTCRRLGVRTVAVYSEADRDSRHVRLADEAYCIGPAASRESYLRADRIVEVAKASGAEAVHPGYGFLSENEGFAEACAAAGIVFIGPPVAAIRAMGSKSAAKALMESAGVPLVPGYHGAEQSPGFLQKQAARIGYPVLIKASAGGGGKGMRVVEAEEDFAAALASCQRESRSSFGDDRVLIEKYLVRPRHIEIQVFGDTQGKVVYLHERDCSAQRRHQKVVEEAPSPGMTPERRAAMGHAACEAARAVGYVGAGTVEFIVDPSGTFYFMEMNTRLQVEHPVTEMITGLDLVEWQLRVAAGQPLPRRQSEIPLHGHAIEVRIYAEDPERDFLPSIGRLTHFSWPGESAQLRVDTGVEQGDAVSPHYDPMLAKLIVWDEESRARAIDRMLQALADFQVVGVANNVSFLSRLVGHPDFRAGLIDTRFIERRAADLLPSQEETPKDVLRVAALWMHQRDVRSAASRAALGADLASPWSIADGWRLNIHHQQRLEFQAREGLRAVTVTHRDNGLDIDGLDCSVLSAHLFSVGGRIITATLVENGGDLHVFVDRRHHLLTPVSALSFSVGDDDAESALHAPMPGKVIALSASVGAVIDKGAPLLVLEAMKMEHTLTAPSRGVVKGYFCAVGEQVSEGSSLIDFEPAS